MRKEIQISKLILDGESVELQDGYIYIEPEVNHANPVYVEHIDWGIEVEGIEYLHIQLIGSLMDIEATSVDGNKYSGCGAFDSIERENGKLANFSIQGIGKLKEHERA